MIGKGFIQGMIYVFRVLIGLGFWFELGCFTQGMIGHTEILKKITNLVHGIIRQIGYPGIIGQIVSPGYDIRYKKTYLVSSLTVLPTL